MTCLTRGSASRAAASTERRSESLRARSVTTGRFVEAVEVVGSTTRGRDYRRGRCLVGDGTGLSGRFLETVDRDIVGVGVAGSGPSLGPHAGPLAHVARGFFHCSFLEYKLFVDTVLEVDIRIVNPSAEGRPEQALHERGGHVEPIGEEALRTLSGKIISFVQAPRMVRRVPMLTRPSPTPQLLHRGRAIAPPRRLAAPSGRPRGATRAGPPLDWAWRLGGVTLLRCCAWHQRGCSRGAGVASAGG